MGSSIHKALELGIAGENYNKKLDVYVVPVLKWLKETKIQLVEREKVLVNLVHGFAGTTDVLFRYEPHGIGIIDYKTRKTKPGEVVKAYDGQSMQLAAYAATYFGEDRIDEVLAANIFISSTEPGSWVPAKKPLIVRVQYTFPVLKSMSKKLLKKIESDEFYYYKNTRPDLHDNLCKATFDALTGIIWQDDSQIVGLHSSKIYGIKPGIIIDIQEVEQ